MKSKYSIIFIYLMMAALILYKLLNPGDSILVAFVILILMISALILTLRASRVQSSSGEEADGNPGKETKMAYIGTVAAGLAHEIRNPLNAIDFNIKMIQEDIEAGDWDETDISERFSSTYKEIKHLERLVSDFLLYARKTVLQLGKTNLNFLIGTISQMLEEEARSNNVKIALNFSDDPIEIEADGEVLRQSLFNIAKNGLESMTEGGTLTFDVSQNITKDKVIIRISDEGIGISPHDLRKIFHLFYTTRRNGTGLGLPVAVSIIENHNGTLDVETEVGVGTTFVITLPSEQETINTAEKE